MIHVDLLLDFSICYQYHPQNKFIFSNAPFKGPNKLRDNGGYQFSHEKKSLTFWFLNKDPYLMVYDS